LGKKQQADKELNDRIEEMEVKENIYTKLTRADLATAAKSVTEALDARKTRYDEELARLKADDALCKQFADKVDPFAKELEANKSKIEKMYGNATLEQQLGAVEANLTNTAQAMSLSELKDLQAKIDERKVAHNPHSLLTVLDAEVLLKQYQVFLNTKKATLEEEIRSKNLRGLSERDMEEIKQQFEQFDKSKNGVLEKNEFKACLYSLGHEKSNLEVVAIMKKFGATDAKGIVYDGFKEFMIVELGDTDTKQDILTGFLLLANENAESISEAPLLDTMKDVDVDYLKQNCKPAGSGLNYKTWTDEVFAR
jgi:actinin alpha